MVSTVASTMSDPATEPASAGSPRVPVVEGLQTGGPRYEVTQEQVREVSAARFPGIAGSGSMAGVFENAEIETRRFARPLDWYLEPHSFAEKNAVYVEEALALAERLGNAALEQAGVAAEEVDAVVFVSSTGLSTPSLDAHLIQRMGIDLGAVRVPLWGLGCAGGAAGLARAGDLVRAGFEHVLLVAVEFCSLTFVLDDASKSNYIGTALFADGGAALVLGAEGAGRGSARPLARLRSAHSALIADSAALTGWDITDAGFELRLSKEIPMMMATNLRPLVDESLEAAGLAIGDVGTVVVHPGGAKVIAGYEAALGLGEHALDSARAVLRDHGNMSSPTVLFVLEEALRGAPTGIGLISATGPGFSAEHLLVDFG